MQCDFLGESHPPTGERPEGVLGGRDGRVDGARSESGAAREQAVIGEIVEGFSQDGRGLWVANYYSARNPLRLSSLVYPGSGR